MSEIEDDRKLFQDFRDTVHRVMANFGIDPAAPETKAEFSMHRTGTYLCSIKKSGTGNMADFMIQIEQAHTYNAGTTKDGAPLNFEAAPGVQFHGYLTPFSLALAMALSPLVMGDFTASDIGRMFLAGSGYPEAAPES